MTRVTGVRRLVFGRWIRMHLCSRSICSAVRFVTTPRSNPVVIASCTASLRSWVSRASTRSSSCASVTDGFSFTTLSAGREVASLSGFWFVRLRDMLQRKNLRRLRTCFATVASEFCFIRQAMNLSTSAPSMSWTGLSSTITRNMLNELVYWILVSGLSVVQPARNSRIASG